MDAQVSSRPPTGSSRFGNMSLNSFFTRHNPHPGRVRHIKGLNDVPICAVHDDGYFPEARYDLRFPPNNFSETKVKAVWERIPVNTMNVGAKTLPQNTLTGLQYFTGMQSYPYRERAIPKMGMVPVTERWREELQALTAAAGLQQGPKPQAQPVKRPMYSAETGRLIPAPSRSMTRGASRRGQDIRQFQHITRQQDMENNVLQMLCQILQTEDVNAVQAWLTSAGDEEKRYVLELIKSAVTTRDEYYRREPALIPAVAEAKDVQQDNVQPPQQGTDSAEKIVQRIDRLALDGVAARGPEAEAEDVARYTRHAYENLPSAPRQLPAREAAQVTVQETAPPPMQEQQAELPESGQAETNEPSAQAPELEPSVGQQVESYTTQ